MSKARMMEVRGDRKTGFRGSSWRAKLCVGWSVAASVATEKLRSLGGWASSKFWDFHPAIRQYCEVCEAD